jgi:hypothetical protein
MTELRYAMLNDEWQVSPNGGFTSPGEDEQMVIFADRVKNGAIEADITPLSGHTTQAGDKSYEASFVFRYAGADGYYYAGLSAFGAKLFVGKLFPGPMWHLRGWAGQRDSIKPKRSYRLRVEFNGNHIILFENGVQQVAVYDESYQIGQCGLRTWRCRARFSDVKMTRDRPRAFLVMPFATQLDFVSRVVHETVEKYGICCKRADEVFISRPVMDDVKAMIAAADIVLVDLTGRNPNVYYEAGLADAWKKDWIVLAQSTDDLTFDLRHIRAILYSNTMGAEVKLREDLCKALNELGYEMSRDAGEGQPPKDDVTQGSSG